MIVDVISNIDETTIGVLKAGTKGLQGDKGWSPILAVIEHDDHLVFQVIDWVGGAGTKPAIGLYVGSSGLVADINDAESLPGVIGPDSASDGAPMVADGVNGTRIKSISFASFKTFLALVKADVGLGNVANLSPANLGISDATQAALDLKAPLASPAFTGTPTVPTASATANTTQAANTAMVQSAIAAYVAAQDVEVFKGSINCSTNPNYPAADAGHVYRVSVAGKIGGASGPNVEAGDRLQCLVDSSAAGNHATVGANWMISQVNIDGAVIGPSSVTDNRIAQFNGTTGKLLEDSGKLVSDFATAAQGAKADTALQGVTAGTNVTINNTNPLNPIISATAGAPDIAGTVHAAAAKTTPVDADEFGIADSAASFVLKKVTWANIKATAKTYFDTLYQPLNSVLTAFVGLSPSNDDILQRKSGAWANRTIAQVKADFGISSFAGTFLDDTSAAAVKTTLGVSDSLALISTQTVGSSVASVTFTSIPSSGYSKFVLVGKNVVTNAAATSDSLGIQVSTDNGSTWKTTSGDYINVSNNAATTRLASPGVAGNTSTFKTGYFELDLPGLGNAARATMATIVEFFNGLSSTTFNSSGQLTQSARSAMEADNAIRIIPLTGTTISAGSVFSLYGVRE